MHKLRESAEMFRRPYADGSMLSGSWPAADESPTRGPAGGLHQLLLEPQPLGAHATQTPAGGMQEKSRRRPLNLPAPPARLPRL